MEMSKSGYRESQAGTILSDDDRDGSSKKGRGPSWGAREHWYR